MVSITGIASVFGGEKGCNGLVWAVVVSIVNCIAVTNNDSKVSVFWNIVKKYFF